MSKFDIFISYSRADSEIVNLFKGRFESEGWNVWMDLDGIESGDAFKRVIVDAIDESKVVVFFASKASNASMWTAKEIGLSLSFGKPVIPVRLDKSNYNKEVAFDLVGIDYIDYSRITDRSWAMDKLVRSLGKKIGVPETAPGPVPEPAPMPVPDPVPAPAPIPVPVPEPISEPIPVPAPPPIPVPVPEPISEPIPVPVPPQVPRPNPEPPKKKKNFWKRFWFIFGVSWGGLVSLFIILIIIGAIAEQCDSPDSDPTIDTVEENVLSSNLLKDAETDHEGNHYDVVQIGEQLWMAENMRATKDRDGNEIALGNDDASHNTPYRYCPDGDPKNVEKYGYLYNWAAAMKVCPSGWHLPTDAEWTELTDYVSGQSQYVCGEDKTSIAKSLASTEGWASYDESCTAGNNLSGNNATGFGAMPAGFYVGDYSSYGYVAIFCSATESSSGVWGYALTFCDTYVERDVFKKSCGFSVRCVKD